MKKLRYKAVSIWTVVDRESGRALDKTFATRQQARKFAKEQDQLAQAKAAPKDVRRVGQRVTVPGGYHRQKGEVIEVQAAQVKVKFDNGEEFWYRPDSLILL